MRSIAASGATIFSGDDVHGVHAWVVDHRLNTLDGTPSLGIHILFKELLGLCIGAPALTHPIGAELFLERGRKIPVAHLTVPAVFG